MNESAVRWIRQNETSAPRVCVEIVRQNQSPLKNNTEYDRANVDEFSV